MAGIARRRAASEDGRCAGLSLRAWWKCPRMMDGPRTCAAHGIPRSGTSASLRSGAGVDDTTRRASSRRAAHIVFMSFMFTNPTAWKGSLLGSFLLG